MTKSKGKSRAEIKKSLRQMPPSSSINAPQPKSALALRLEVGRASTTMSSVGDVKSDVDETVRQRGTLRSDAKMTIMQDDDFDNLMDQRSSPTPSRLSPVKKRKLLDGPCDELISSDKVDSRRRTDSTTSRYFAKSAGATGTSDARDVSPDPRETLSASRTQPACKPLASPEEEHIRTMTPSSVPATAASPTRRHVEPAAHGNPGSELAPQSEAQPYTFGDMYDEAEAEPKPDWQYRAQGLLEAIEDSDLCDYLAYQAGNPDHALENAMNQWLEEDNYDASDDEAGATFGRGIDFAGPPSAVVKADSDATSWSASCPQTPKKKLSESLVNDSDASDDFGSHFSDPIDEFPFQEAPAEAKDEESSPVRQPKRRLPICASPSAPTAEEQHDDKSLLQTSLTGIFTKKSSTDHAPSFPTHGRMTRSWTNASNYQAASWRIAQAIEGIDDDDSTDEHKDEPCEAEDLFYVPPQDVFADVPTLDHIPQWSPRRGVHRSPSPSFRPAQLRPALSEKDLNRPVAGENHAVPTFKPSLFSPLHQDRPDISFFCGAFDMGFGGESCAPDATTVDAGCLETSPVKMPPAAGQDFEYAANESPKQEGGAPLVGRPCTNRELQSLQVFAEKVARARTDS